MNLNININPPSEESLKNSFYTCRAYMDKFMKQPQKNILEKHKKRIATTENLLQAAIDDLKIFERDSGAKFKINSNKKIFVQDIYNKENRQKYFNLEHFYNEKEKKRRKSDFDTIFDFHAKVCELIITYNNASETLSCTKNASGSAITRVKQNVIADMWQSFSEQYPNLTEIIRAGYENEKSKNSALKLEAYIYGNISEIQITENYDFSTTSKNEQISDRQF